MSHYDSSELHMHNLFDAITEALLTGQDEMVEYLIDQSEVSRAKAEELLDVIDGLRASLSSQEPSVQFVRQLKADLTGERAGLVTRIRFLPGRVQIAAGLALVAGFALILRRRFSSDDGESVDIPALLQ